jgi:hypothetical protein
MTHNQFRTRLLSAEGVEELVIDEIEAQEREGKKLLGAAGGPDMNFCAYLGVKHCDNFTKRVKWYYITDEHDHEVDDLRTAVPGSLYVEFYE